MAFRIDVGRVDALRILADGRLVTTARLTRAGVFLYRMPDGSIQREYRPPEEVFSPASMETYRLAPVTNNHPPQMLTSENARQYAVGTTGDSVQKDGKYVASPICVFDQQTIEDMQNGKREVSLGYEVELIEESGVSPDGEEYDAIQRRIRVNHAAIVDEGRAGPEVRVRMDGVAQMVGQEADVASATTNGVEMDELAKALKDAAEQRARADTAEAARDEQKARADKAEQELKEKDSKLQQEKERADKAESDRDEQKTRADKAEGERDGEKARADKAEQERKDASDSIGDLVKKRVALHSAASSVLAKEIKEGEVKLDEMADLDVKVAVIKKVDGADSIPEDRLKDEGYIEGRFDSSVRVAEKSAEANGVVRQTLVENRGDGTGPEDPEKAAMRENAQRSRDAWKKDAKKEAN